MWIESVASLLLNDWLRSRPARPAGLSLGKTTDAPLADVVFEDRLRCQHAVILGKSGSGKTYLLESLAEQIAKKREGFAFIDFHGDASLSLIGRLLQLSKAKERLVILDPSHEYRSPAINILESDASDVDRFRRVSELSAILRQRWGVDAFGARTEELLRNSLYTLAANRRALVDLPLLLTDTCERAVMVQALDHPDIVAYWTNRYEPLSEAMKAAFREPLLNKVTAFLTEPAARHLLGQRESTISMAAVIQNQQWLIIRLPKGRLREHAHTLGNLLFAQLQFALLARDVLTPRERHTFTLLCDEAQNLAENDLQTLLTEGRKFGCSVVSANQYFDQLPRSLRGALLSAHTHICFRVTSGDAHVFASELSLGRKGQLAVELTHLRLGEAFASLSGQGVKRFRVPPMSKATPISPSELTDLVAPVTRLRTEVEKSLRQARQSPPLAAPLNSEEGQRDW